MGERSWEPLAIAILGLLLAIMSYGIKDGGFGSVVYGSGLMSAGLSLAHWFGTPDQGV